LLAILRNPKSVDEPCKFDIEKSIKCIRNQRNSIEYYSARIRQLVVAKQNHQYFFRKPHYLNLDNIVHELTKKIAIINFSIQYLKIRVIQDASY
jgi:hypothetical protein